MDDCCRWRASAAPTPLELTFHVCRSSSAGLAGWMRGSYGYREIDGTWNGRFDAVICNGSIEHFVQAEDVRAGRSDEIYRELFEICHRVIDPAFVAADGHHHHSSQRTHP